MPICARDRKQQRAEQHDRRNAFEHAAEHDERDDRYRHEHRRAARQRAHRAARAVPRSPTASAPRPCAVAAPMMSRIAPDSAAVSTSIGFSARPLEAAIDQQARRAPHRRCRWWRLRSPSRCLRPPPRGSRTAARAPAPRSRSLRTISPRVARAHGRQVVAAIAPPHDRRTASTPSTTPGSMPPVKSAAIDTPVTEPMRDQHEARRDRLGLRAGRGEQRDQIAGLRAALPSSRGTAPARPRPCRRPSSRRCPTPDTSRRPARTTGRRARDRAGSRETRPSRAAMPVISINWPRNTNSGTDEQDQVRHALVHAADHDDERRARREREIAEGREAERERDRHARAARRAPPGRRRRSAG